MDDKLVRLSDVIETVENQCSDGNMWGNENLTLIDADKTIDELSDIPAVDAVEVVRCRDCKNWETDWEPNYFNPDNPSYYCGENDIFPTGDWFCADGQRREDGDNGKHL